MNSIMKVYIKWRVLFGVATFLVFLLVLYICKYQLSPWLADKLLYAFCRLIILISYLKLSKRFHSVAAQNRASYKQLLGGQCNFVFRYVIFYRSSKCLVFCGGEETCVKSYHTAFNGNNQLHEYCNYPHHPAAGLEGKMMADYGQLCNSQVNFKIRLPIFIFMMMWFFFTFCMKYFALSCWKMFQIKSLS